MSKQIQDAFELLGKKVRDRVTMTKGVVTSISFDLYGCVCAIVHPGINKEGAVRDTAWFDISRLKITSDKPVMDVPTFGLVRGPAAKPKFMKP